MLLEKNLFDPIWTQGKLPTANPYKRDVPSLQLVPQMKSALVYRNYQAVVNHEQGKTYSVDARKLREVFSAKQRHVLTDENSMQQLASQLIEKNVITGFSSTSIKKPSSTMLLALFSAIRERGLVYDLIPNGKKVDLIVLLNDKISLSNFQVFSQAWMPVEEIKEILIEVENGSTDISTVESSGFAGEANLKFKFIPWGNWSEVKVEAVQLIYQLSTDSRVVAVGTERVRVDRGEEHSVLVSSLENKQVQLRSKIVGYYRNDGKYEPLRKAEWSMVPTSLRRHFHFLMPDDISSDKGGS